MTAATLDSPSQDSFWEESNLPPAAPEEAPADATHLVNPPANTCPTCGEEVIREPGSRGRIPKYHPECKPVKGTRASTGPRAVRVAAKDRLAQEQVEAAIDRARGGIAKAVMLMSLADPYDALVLNVNSEDLLAHMRVLLMRFPRLRETASDATTVTSIFGIVITLLSIGLPIAAHHKLIPSAKLQQVFLNIPLFMMRMQERMATMDPDAINHDLITQVKEKARAAQEAAQRLKTAGESVDASTR